MSSALTDHVKNQNNVKIIWIDGFLLFFHYQFYKSSTIQHRFSKFPVTLEA